MRTVRPFLFVALVATAGAIACAGGPREKPIKTTPINKEAGSTEAARKFLEGRWALLSFDVFPPGAAPISVKGTGVLTYDDFGNLRAELRVDQPTADGLARVGIDTDQGVFSSDGRTIIDIPGKKLTYVIEGQPPAASGPLALSRPRYWEVDGDVLTITTRGDNGQPLSVAKWKKQP